MYESVVPTQEPGFLRAPLLRETVVCPGCKSEYEVGRINSEDGTLTTKEFHTRGCDWLAYLASGC
jgi:hypothetical protein